MSVESEILRIQRNIADTYAAVAEKGGQVPLQPNSANLAAAVASIPLGSASAGGVPIGTIVIWSGTADNIPAGWQLCDGTNGTPDLRDKFVLGAGTNHAVGKNGGSEEVTLTVGQMPKHLHKISISVAGSGSNMTNSYAAPGYVGSGSVVNGNSEYVGSTMPHNNMPPYYALCYIMKLTADETDSITMDQVNSAIDAKLDAYEPQEVYSTEETRIGTWIDGKPLYRKAFIYDAAGYTANKDITIYTDSTIDSFTFYYGLEITSGYTLMCNAYTGPGYVAQDLNAIWCRPGGRVYFRGGTGAVGSMPHVIIEYTKTTDQPTVSTAEILSGCLGGLPAGGLEAPATAAAPSGAKITNQEEV